MPAGLIRDWSPRDVPAIARIEIASWRAAYIGIIEAWVLDRMDFARIAIRWQRGLDRGLCVKIAEADGKVRGFASRNGDEITMLYVDPAHWRQGIGRALLRAKLEDIAVSGAAGAWLWVLAANERARRFYAAEGGIAFDHGRTLVGGRNLDQVRYRWTLASARRKEAARRTGR